MYRRIVPLHTIGSDSLQVHNRRLKYYYLQKKPVKAQTEPFAHQSHGRDDDAKRDNDEEP